MIAAAEAMMEQFNRIMQELAAGHADRFFMGPVYDHRDEGHFCCALIYGLPGSGVATDSLEADTCGRLVLHRWALLGMITDLTGGAVEITIYENPVKMHADADALWPELPALMRHQREEDARKTHDVMGHA